MKLSRTVGLAYFVLPVSVFRWEDGFFYFIANFNFFLGQNRSGIINRI